MCSFLGRKNRWCKDREDRKIQEGIIFNPLDVMLSFNTFFH